MSAVTREVNDDKRLGEIMESHLRQCGNEVIVVVTDAALEDVGEALLIATHGELDRKTVGKICFQQALKYLLGPQQTSASIVIN
jgi:hypothetical protein